MRFFSQHGEDRWLFPRTAILPGAFVLLLAVDVGAFDGD